MGIDDVLADISKIQFHLREKPLKYKQFIEHSFGIPPTESDSRCGYVFGLSYVFTNGYDMERLKADYDRLFVISSVLHSLPIQLIGSDDRGFFDRYSRKFPLSSVAIGYLDLQMPSLSQIDSVFEVYDTILCELIADDNLLKSVEVPNSMK